MLGSILAGRFAVDIISYVVNKITQTIVGIVILIFKCLRFIARKIIAKIKEIRDACRRKGMKIAADLNHKIKMQT